MLPILGLPVDQIDQLVRLILTDGSDLYLMGVYRPPFYAYLGDSRFPRPDA